MSHFVAYILQFQEIIVYKIPPGGRGSIASLRSTESSLCAQWVAKDPSFLHADSEDSDQTGRMLVDY